LPAGRTRYESYRLIGNQRSGYLTDVSTEVPDPGVPLWRQDNRPKSFSRRELLKLSPALLLGAFAVPRLRDPLLDAGLRLSDWASSQWFRSGHLAPTYDDSQVTPSETFPLNSYDVDDPEVDLPGWTLTVAGDVQHPGEYTLAQIRSLPKLRQNTRHVCVEGWDVIGSFGGARLSDFLRLVGANLNARFLYFECADDYYESLDMPSALHKQSLLCYEMYHQPLTRGHGAPLRLQLPTKIGYKQAKYLTSLRVTDVVARKGYWEDLHESSFPDQQAASNSRRPVSSLAVP
jgi:DMSO/TMAO reductase YedYZ molybdopterin-dependent catalytic subunit